MGRAEDDGRRALALLAPGCPLAGGLWIPQPIQVRAARMIARPGWGFGGTWQQRGGACTHLQAGRQAGMRALVRVRACMRACAQAAVGACVHGEPLTPSAHARTRRGRRFGHHLHGSAHCWRQRAATRCAHPCLMRPIPTATQGDGLSAHAAWAGEGAHTHACMRARLRARTHVRAHR